MATLGQDSNLLGVAPPSNLQGTLQYASPAAKQAFGMGFGAMDMANNEQQAMDQQAAVQQVVKTASDLFRAGQKEEALLTLAKVKPDLLNDQVVADLKLDRAVLQKIQEAEKVPVQQFDVNQDTGEVIRLQGAPGGPATAQILRSGTPNDKVSKKDQKDLGKLLLDRADKYETRAKPIKDAITEAGSLKATINSPARINKPAAFAIQFNRILRNVGQLALQEQASFTELGSWIEKQLARGKFFATGELDDGQRKEMLAAIAPLELVNKISLYREALQEANRVNSATGKTVTPEQALEVLDPAVASELRSVKNLGRLSQGQNLEKVLRVYTNEVKKGRTDLTIDKIVNALEKANKLED
jgi:hypothetical protein